MKTTVMKDDHTFTVHILDPKDPQAEDSEPDTPLNSDRSGAEKAEFEKPEKENKGEFVAPEGMGIGTRGHLHCVGLFHVRAGRS